MWVAVTMGYPVDDLPIGYEVLPAEGGVPENTMCVILSVDDVISVDVQLGVVNDPSRSSFRGDGS